MKARFPVIITAVAKIVFVPLVCMALSGCIDDKHYIHRDFVSEVAGDAIAVNTATQTDNPWPKESRNANINVDAKRLNLAVRRYRQNKSIKPRGLSTTDATKQDQQTQMNAQGDMPTPPPSPQQ